MASSFMGLYVQREALLVSQKALDVTGNNIANIKTKGYTRQRVDVASVANTGGNLGYNTRVSLAGKGVEGVGVTQIRDALLDEKYRKYSTDVTDTAIKANVLSDIDDALDDIEADDAGFAAILGKFKESLQAFSSDNADRNEIANVALGAAKNVVQVINDFSTRMNSVADNTIGDAKSTTDRINAIFKEIAGLNDQIKDSYIQMGYISNDGSGYKVDNNYGPLELKDKMNLLIDELAEYGNINVKEETTGQFSITFAGKVAVSGRDYAQIAMTEDNPALGGLGFVMTNAGAYDPVTQTYADLKTAAEWQTQIDASGTLEAYVRDTAIPADIISDGTFKVGENFTFAADFNTTEDFTAQGDIKDSLGTVIFADGDNVPAGTTLATGTVIAAGSTIPKGVTVLAGTKSTVPVNSTDITGKANIAGGSLRGYIDMYNGNGLYADTAAGENNYQGIYYYKNMINALAKSFSDEFNVVYKDFGFEVFNYGNDFDTAAENLRVSGAWIGNPELISKPQLIDPAAFGSVDDEYEELNNTYVNKMLGVLEREHSFGNGKYVTDPVTGVTTYDGKKEALNHTLQDYVIYYGNKLGSQCEYEKNVVKTKEIMVTSAAKARDEVMGVSMEEEGVNMMNYQKWYNAIARMVTSIDQCLEKLINGTGVCGL